MTAADHANTVRDPIALLRERIVQTRQEYGFPDIENRYPGTLLSGFLLRDAVALVAALDALQAQAEDWERRCKLEYKVRMDTRETLEAAEAERDRLAEIEEAARDLIELRKHDRGPYYERTAWKRLYAALAGEDT